MKKLMLLTITAALVILSTFASAQTTASGTLNVTATVNGSISLVFNSDASGVGLTGAGTNAATLAFGSVQAYGGTVPAGVTRTTGASSFTVSSPFDVLVDKSNSASANYTLKAQLNTADTINTWQVGGSTVTNAAATTLTATGAYGTNNALTLALTIPFTTASGTNISNSFSFTATAN